jgi:ethanolamine utilization protein EutN
MYLGKVIGRVVSTVKDPRLTSQRLLIVQPLTPEKKPTGKQVICTDCVGAGAGEIIYYSKGKESSFPFLPLEVPTDMTIVGIVDSVRVERS